MLLVLCNYNDCRGGKTPAVLNTDILLLFSLLEGGRGEEGGEKGKVILIDSIYLQNFK